MQQYELSEPFGPLADEARAFSIVAKLHNIHRAEKQPATSPADHSAVLARYVAEHKPPDPAPKKLAPADEAAALDALFGFK